MCKGETGYKCKLLVFTDSAFVEGRATTLQIPTTKIEFATAKSRKIACWAEDIAWSRDMPIKFGGILGKYLTTCLTSYHTWLTR